MTAAPPERFFRPTWAEVDLGRLRENLRRFKRRIGRSRLMLVAKGNAYGHGAAAVAREAESSRLASWLGVSSVEEGIALREAGVRLPVLVLGSLYPFESFLAAVRFGLTPTIASLEAARKLAEVARALGAAEEGSRVRCHLKLDTGMGRIGVGWPSGREVVEFIAREPRLLLEGVYTHFASAEDPASARAQLALFCRALADIRRAGIRPPLAHAANSAAGLSLPGSRLDMVRPGLAIYGLYGAGFKPVLSLKTRVVFIKNVRPGSRIGYGGAFRARGRSRIATLPVGYADGLPRLLSNRAEVLVGGRRCRVAGTVTMDMTMVDVTRAPDVHVGDEAVLLGASGREEIGAAEWAVLARTIPYEIVTRLSPRVPRVPTGR